jgi:hypothetical protein
VRPPQDGVLQVGPTQVGALQAHAGKLGFFQERIVQVGALQMQTAHVSLGVAHALSQPGDIRAGQSCAVEGAAAAAVVLRSLPGGQRGAQLVLAALADPLTVARAPSRRMRAGEYGIEPGMPTARAAGAARWIVRLVVVVVGLARCLICLIVHGGLLSWCRRTLVRWHQAYKGQQAGARVDAHHARTGARCWYVQERHAIMTHLHELYCTVELTHPFASHSSRLAPTGATRFSR